MFKLKKNDKSEFKLYFYFNKMKKSYEKIIFMKFLQNVLDLNMKNQTTTSKYKLKIVNKI